jgi:hypothetical protein
MTSTRPEDRIEMGGARLERPLPLRVRARGHGAEADVAVLGVGDDEIAGTVLAVADGAELGVEGLLGHAGIRRFLLRLRPLR